MSQSSSIETSSSLYSSDWGLGRSEGLEQRRVLQRAEAGVGGVSEDEVGPREEVGRRHPDLPQALLVLRPKEELILFTHTSRPSTPTTPENFFQQNKSTQNIRNCDSKETHWKLRLLYCETLYRGWRSVID